MSSSVGKCCSALGGCVRCCCKVGTARQRLITAFLLLSAVSLAFCVSAGISATAILAVQKSLTDNGATTLSCSGSNTTLQSITLLSADCVAGIFLALLHFIICTWVISGRVFTRGAPGTVYAGLAVASFYSGVCLLSLAGTMNIGSSFTSTWVGGCSPGVTWESSDDDTFKAAWALQYATGAMQFVFLLVLLQSRRELVEDAVAALGGAQPPPPRQPPADGGSGGLFGFGRARRGDVEAGVAVAAAVQGGQPGGGGGGGGGGFFARSNKPAPAAPPAVVMARPAAAPSAEDNPWGGPVVTPRRDNLFAASTPRWS